MMQPSKQGTGGGCGSRDFRSRGEGRGSPEDRTEWLLQKWGQEEAVVGGRGLSA